MKTSVDDRLHDGVLEIATHRVDRFLNHQHPGHLILAIDPEVRAEGPGPAEAAVGQRGIRLSAIHHHAHAQTESHPRPAGPRLREQVTNVIRGHLLDGPWTE